MTRFCPAVAAGALLVVLAYANHWNNPFHFDDDHTIVHNASIRELTNLPRLLTDATAASIYPTHAVYRPLTYVTLAVDYAIAGGLEPAVFHFSTFLGFLGLLASLLVLTRRVLDAAVRDPANRWYALFGTTLFGVHPVAADTVNYIIQRAELWAAAGVVASMAIFAARPDWRRYGLFLIPAVLAVLAKTTAAIFPFLVFAYQAIVEREPRIARWPTMGAALVAAALVMGLCSVMTFSTGTFDPGAPPFAQYVWTQPWVALRYLRSFPLPVDLSIDPGWAPLASPLEGRALAGYLGVLLLVISSIVLARRRETAAVAFGLGWFMVALLPASIYPLAEVTNDHRMFLPHMGLAMATAGGLQWMAQRDRRPRRSIGLVVALVVLTVASIGTWQRNKVWSSDEAVWRDASAKNPANGRARMNYGVALMQRGDLVQALRELEQAAVHSPRYHFLEVNLGIVKAALGRPAEAEAHFERSLALAPHSPVGYFHYGRWLRAQGRDAEAIARFQQALAIDADDLRARHELLSALAHPP
ncbi:MAG: tetratricopeptide repeat protein [Acidobacteria bacterium]|nr:tetratricopeptide repeat protein [Acidobacteriota bacterium]